MRKNNRLKLAAAAAYLGVSEATVWRYIGSGLLRKCQLMPRRGSPVFLYVEDLDALIAHGTSQAGE